MRFFNCVIIKSVLNTVVKEHVWLPEEHAYVDKMINIKDRGEWDYGWKVTEVNIVNPISSVIESKDINTAGKPAEKVYRGKGDDFKYKAFEPRDKDHQ